MPSPNNRCRRGRRRADTLLRAFFSPPAKLRPAARRDNTTIMILAHGAQRMKVLNFYFPTPIVLCVWPPRYDVVKRIACLGLPIKRRHAEVSAS